MLKRALDILFSVLGLIMLFPFIMIIGLLIKMDSAGPVIFKQRRIGKDYREFTLYKFRTMFHNNKNSNLPLTLSNRDKRITRIGYFMRKFKVDEFPQLVNVIKGDMSLVGPRPEVERYIRYFPEEYRKILAVRPGITDFASVKYRNENEILAEQENPEDYYVNVLLKDKIRLNNYYLVNHNFLMDIRIILATVFRSLIFLKSDMRDTL